MYRYHRQLLLLRVTGQCHLHRSHRCLRLYFCCPCHHLGLRPGGHLDSRPFFMTIKITSQAKNVKIYLSSFHRTQQWQLWCPPMLGLVWTTSSTMTTLFGLRPTPRLPTQIGIMSDNVDSEMRIWSKCYSQTTGLVQATRSTPRTQMSTAWRRWRRRRASGTMWAAPNSWTMLAAWRPLKPVHSMQTNVLNARNAKLCLQ